MQYQASAGVRRARSVIARMAITITATVASLAAFCAAQPTGAAALSTPRIYWANENGNDIGAANLDGTDVTQSFITGAHSPYGVAVDGTHLYWGNIAFFAQPSIGIANLDGTAVNQSLVLTNDDIGMAVNDQHIYWAGGSIREANLDGSGVNQNLTPDVGAFGGLAVDGRYIYWASSFGNAIGRANLDGTGIDPKFIALSGLPTGLAVNGQHIYWTEQGLGTIGEANLDGTDVNESLITLGDSPVGVAVDAQHVYWTNQGNGTIGEANLDGTDVNQSFITGASDPAGIAVSVPIAQLTPAGPRAFSPTPQGSLSGPLQLTVTNAGQRSLSVNGVSFTGADPGDFLVGADSCLGAVDPGNSCQVEVYFAPEGQGVRNATLLIATSDLANSPLQVALSGTGGPPPQGPPGATGPPGPRAPSGKIELLACRTVTERADRHGHGHGHGVKRRRMRCAGRLISGTAKFSDSVVAALTRGRRVYAVGTRIPLGAGVSELMLSDLRPLTNGRYVLTVRTRRGHRFSTARIPVVIRQ